MIVFLAIHWLKELVEILQEIHNRGIIHRDIKPTNIMYKPDGHLSLIDFGVVKEYINTEGVTRKDSNTILGDTIISSLGYTPPEQMYGKAVFASDFFALGRTFVYLMTTKEPTDNEIYDANNDKLCWREHAGNCLLGLADLIDSMMARTYRERPANAQEILQILQSLATSSKDSAFFRTATLSTSNDGSTVVAKQTRTTPSTNNHTIVINSPTRNNLAHNST